MVLLCRGRRIHYRICRDDLIVYRCFLDLKHSTQLHVTHQSVSWFKTVILRIMSKRPMVTTISKAKENQPIAIALDPTPDLTLPLPRSWAMILAATDAVCCHRTDTKTNIEATKMIASEICETNRDGKGFTSRSEPSLSSSSCQPGKVAKSRRQMKANMMAMILYRFVFSVHSKNTKMLGKLLKLTSSKGRQSCP